MAEAATRGALEEKMFLEISQNSKENTCVRVSFLIKLNECFLRGSYVNLCSESYDQNSLIGPCTLHKK